MKKSSKLSFDFSTYQFGIYLVVIVATSGKSWFEFVSFNNNEIKRLNHIIANDDGTIKANISGTTITYSGFDWYSTCGLYFIVKYPYT